MSPVTRMTARWPPKQHGINNKKRWERCVRLVLVQGSGGSIGIIHHTRLRVIGGVLWRDRHMMCSLGNSPEGPDMDTVMGFGRECAVNSEALRNKDNVPFPYGGYVSISGHSAQVLPSRKYIIAPSRAL